MTLTYGSRCTVAGATTLMSKRSLRSGEVASLAGVSVATLRYYERRELIPHPRRTDSGYRVYPAETVNAVRMIKRAQRIGFSLREISQLLALRSRRAATCADVFSTAALKMKDLEARIATLEQARRDLAEILGACPRRRDVEAHACPIYHRLGELPESPA